jgi:hypothetical protein
MGPDHVARRQRLASGCLGLLQKLTIAPGIFKPWYPNRWLDRLSLRQRL